MLLVGVSLHTSLEDRWQWLLDISEGYSVHGAYDMLTSEAPGHARRDLDLVWHKKVPLKVSIFAWRLLRDRHPTKTNLAIRGILPVESRSCVFGCGQVENARHL